jgi:hypothetical protein
MGTLRVGPSDNNNLMITLILDTYLVAAVIMMNGLIKLMISVVSAKAPQPYIFNLVFQLTLWSTWS